MNIKGIIFDFGFTLFYFKDVDNYFECFKKGFRKSVDRLKELNILKDELSVKKFVKTFKNKRGSLFRKSVKTKIEFPTKKIFQIVLEKIDPNLGNLDDEFYKELADLFHFYEEEEWIPFNHTKDTLDKLSELEINLAVLSNHGHHSMIEKVLKKHDLAKYFNVIVTSAQFGKRKPDPEIFFYTLKEMGIEIPSSCLICGDEHADVVGGHRAGLQTILCERMYKFPFEQEINVPELIQVKDISEIIPYIKQI